MDDIGFPRGISAASSRHASEGPENAARPAFQGEVDCVSHESFPQDGGLSSAKVRCFVLVRPLDCPVSYAPFGLGVGTALLCIYRADPKYLKKMEIFWDKQPVVGSANTNVMAILRYG